MPPNSLNYPNHSMQNAYYWDWWNNPAAAAYAGYSAIPPGLTNPSPFDMGYRDELNKRYSK